MKSSRNIVFCPVLLILFFFYSCANLFPTRQENIEEKFKRAVYKAKEYQNLKRSKTLFSISSHNNLIKVMCKVEWGCQQGGTKNWEQDGVFKKGVRVKVVSWATHKNRSFEENANMKKKIPSGKWPIWVTASPELKSFCQGLSSTENRELRLKQYLGLRPAQKKKAIVSFWVEPEDLFRPCYDPQIHNNSCGVSPSPETSKEHFKWMEKEVSYAFPPNKLGVPWTRLGYSYDWGQEESYFGASEYIIKPNAKVFIESVESLDTFCSP